MKIYKLAAFLFLISISCSKDDNNQQDDPFQNFTSVLCPEVTGISGAYWDHTNGKPLPLTEVPLIKNPGERFIHSQYPALGFTMPQGYTGNEVFNAQTNTIGVNVLRNDNEVVWRYVPSGTFNGQVPVTDVMAFEINSMFSFYGFNGQPEVVCSETRTINNGTLITTFSARFLRFNNITAVAWVNVHYQPSLNVTFIATSLSAAPTNEFDTMVAETFLPISWQLLVGPERVQDTDLDGVPDEQDADPLDPNVQ